MRFCHAFSRFFLGIQGFVLTVWELRKVAGVDGVKGAAVQTHRKVCENVLAKNVHGLWAATRKPNTRKTKLAYVRLPTHYRAYWRFGSAEAFSAVPASRDEISGGSFKAIS